jgi:hypothetical protein
MTEIPGESGPLHRRVDDIVCNEVPAHYAKLARRRLTESLEVWRAESQTRIEAIALEMFSRVMPGQTKEELAADLAGEVVDAICGLPLETEEQTTPLW